MDYELEDEGLVNPDAHEPIVRSEQCGVAHLVHGWIQQNMPNKVILFHYPSMPYFVKKNYQGLFISGDISHSSTTLAAAGSYYYMTKSIAETIGAMFKATFPEWYDRYKEAFDAGVWLSEDPGPFLGRAIIYKLQGRLHKDRNDLGPSASFGVGNYSGGEMLFPQLHAKFS
jgi:hypothetical protein